jgi:hypothetical protein
MKARRISASCCSIKLTETKTAPRSLSRFNVSRNGIKSRKCGFFASHISRGAGSLILPYVRPGRASTCPHRTEKLFLYRYRLAYWRKRKHSFHSRLVPRRVMAASEGLWGAKSAGHWARCFRGRTVHQPTPLSQPNRIRPQGTAQFFHPTLGERIALIL